jgi:hypothetical protein
MSLDDLVATRKINPDQKAQLEKKPALQAQLAQLQEQVTIFKKLEDEFKARSEVEKVEFEKAFTDRTDKELEEKIAAAKAEAVASAEANQKEAFLLLSQFLRLAAIRRGDEEADVELDENKALEGVLSQVYTGDSKAVETMVNLIQGSEKPTVSIANEALETTCRSLQSAKSNLTNINLVRQIKDATIANAPPPFVEELAGETEEGTAVEISEYPAQSDPTIANAGLTELDEPSATTLTNGHESHEVQGIPQNSSFGEGGNAAAEANWDNANDLSTSQEWVEVPRDATETDTGLTATPAAPSNVQSWADDQPDVVEVRTLVSQISLFTFNFLSVMHFFRMLADHIRAQATPVPPTNPNDGFHEVQRSRGGNRGDGQRGRGRGGDRGRGRGDYRGGRGRGGPRGGGGARGGRRPDDS